MKSPSVQAELCVLLLLGGAALPICGNAAEYSKHDPSYADLQGEALLDNPRVYVQKFIVQPGQSTGRHMHPADQLLVFIKGGVLKSQATGRATLWRDGRVVWQNATDLADEGSTNTGATPIEMDLVTLKPVAQSAAGAPGGKPKYQYLNYPNIPGEDVLENDQVIVQRFIVQPGQWEGVHAHCPDMLFIHIKGGQWAAKSYKEPEHPYPNPSPDGEAGWMPTIDISVGHQSGNIGKSPIDLVWVTLKK
jgi:predicted metal-dependent enzyme (double-stranded beta helix superfamily)